METPSPDPASLNELLTLGSTPTISRLVPDDGTVPPALMRGSDRITGETVTDGEPLCTTSFGSSVTDPEWAVLYFARGTDSSCRSGHRIVLPRRKLGPGEHGAGRKTPLPWRSSTLRRGVSRPAEPHVMSVRRSCRPWRPCRECPTFPSRPPFSSRHRVSGADALRAAWGVRGPMSRSGAANVTVEPSFHRTGDPEGDLRRGSIWAGGPSSSAGRSARRRSGSKLVSEPPAMPSGGGTARPTQPRSAPCWRRGRGQL